MQWLQIVFPSFGLCCALFLAAFSYLHFEIFSKTKYARARYLLFFCLVSIIPCMLQVFVQSRIFSKEIVLWAAITSSMINSVVRYYYLRSISYFVAIPDRFLKVAYMILGILGLISCLMLYSELFGGPFLFVDSANIPSAGNYFINSYFISVGPPSDFIKTLLTFYALFDAVYSLFIIVLIWRSTKDIWFLSGLFICLFIAVEHFLLPFTSRYYLPLFFFSYFLEALRMTYFSAKEYLIENEVKKGILQKITPDKDTEKYQNSNLSEDRILQLAETVKTVLSTSKIYKDPNLKLEKLAAQVGIPGYQLSQVIGLGLNSRFYELINSYRIQSIINDFRDIHLEDKTIIDIALDNGFNSKSTFNLSFKKITGKTPTEFRHEVELSRSKSL